MKKILLGIVGLIGFACVAMAGPGMTRDWKGEDLGVALRIQNGYTVTVSCSATGDNANVFVVIGDFTNTIDCSGAACDTVAELAASVRACTNAAGKALLNVDYDCALGADRIDTRLVYNSTTTVVSPGQWGSAFLWDTSVSLSYDAYSPGDKVGGTLGDRIITKIYGDAGGTGNVTLQAFVNGSEVWSRQIVSPIYVFGATLTNDTATATSADAVSPGQFIIDLNFPVARSENFLLRATRATTGTTGGIGFAAVENR